MTSSTLQYIICPVTLVLSFVAGGIDFSNESTTENSKDGNQPAKFSRRNTSSNDSTNGNSVAINRHLSATGSLLGKGDYAVSYDIKEITNTRDPQKRMTMLLGMIDQLGPGDFEQVVTDFRKLGLTQKRMAEYELILNAWSKINPEGAIAYASENTNTTFATTTVLKAWAEYAPDAAIQWVKLNHKGDKASPYLVDIIRSIASNNPQRATDMLPDLHYQEHHDAVRAIIPHISKLGTEEAIAWLASLKDERPHSLPARWLASSLARKDPQATIDWLQTFPEDIQKNSYGGTIADALAELDINKAVEWTNSLDPKNKSYTAYRIMKQFASSDPIKAAAWMKTMLGDDLHGHTLRSFFSSTKHDHPKVALANLDQLPQVRQRNRYKGEILLNWAAKDKGAATQWMHSNGMDPAAQKKFLSAATADGLGRRSRSHQSIYPDEHLMQH